MDKMNRKKDVIVGKHKEKDNTNELFGFNDTSDGFGGNTGFGERPNKCKRHKKKNSKNIVRICGDRVDLCLFRTDNKAIKKYTKWMADPSINIWIGNHRNVIELAEEKRWALRETEPNIRRFNIVEKSTDKLIGNCDIKLNKYSRTAVLGILIGEEKARHKGYGSEAIRIMLGYCFRSLNMHSVTLQLNSRNHSAYKCYRSCGFTVCGVERNSEWVDGKWCATLTMQILDKEYFCYCNRILTIISPCSFDTLDKQELYYQLPSYYEELTATIHEVQESLGIHHENWLGLSEIDECEEYYSDGGWDDDDWISNFNEESADGDWGELLNELEL